MTRHSRNCTAGAFYSYAERKKDSESSGFGSANKRMSKDSVSLTILLITRISVCETLCNFQESRNACDLTNSENFSSQNEL